MKNTEELVINSLAKLEVLQGNMELLMSFVITKTSKEEFIEHLRFVVNSPCFGKEAKQAAHEMLRQDGLWTHDMLEGVKQ